MSRVSTKDVLQSKGYSYLCYTEPSSDPNTVDVLFKDIVPELSSLEIGNKRLYLHQYEAYSKLKEGLNVVLRAGTGSGKTEAWVLYLLERLKSAKDYYAIALYPTLALANDQIRRLEKYFEAINRRALQLDSLKKDELLKRSGPSELKYKVVSSNLLVTNPAFLLHDLKKYFIKKESSLLSPLYSRLNLLVVDELDFYSPRSLALLLAMISLLSEVSERDVQVVALSAGIANPEDLCAFIEGVTGRKCVNIEGEPFRVANYTYIVLGKNLEAIWMNIREMWPNVLGSHPELRSLSEVISSFSKFKERAYQVISIIEGLGYSVPSLSVDASELIQEYFKDAYVTLVFTRSISVAEELVRSLRTKLGADAPIAAHHHLVPKALREEVENRARKGEVKVIVSPRTLSQGIDIGLVARIVHLGLPDDVREYYQREGRKGRRKELEFSETVILPYSRWDRELLSNGVEAFKSWLNLGLEKTLVNSDNLYTYLLTGTIKLISPWFKRDLCPKEREALERAGVISAEGRPNEKLLRDVFERLNFYEYAPPYGIKRYIERKGKLQPLEPIGHCDLVEKFQPGCIDYGEEAIVVTLEHGRTSRLVKSVIERDIREMDFRSYDGLAEAVEEYRYIKMKWNEHPNIMRDLLAGRIASEMLCVVYTPRNGFGKYVKVPERCIWTVRSERPRCIFARDKPIVYYDKRAIYVPMPVGGEYRDFTYGYTYSIDSRENADLIRLALAFLMVALRRFLGIPFETIMYDVVRIGEYKYFSLHEPEAAGIIEKIDWLNLRRAVSSYVPDELDHILISEIDDIAYSTLVTVEFNWDLVKETAVRVIDYILARDKIRAVFKDVEISIPKPSPALKILSYAIVSEVLDEESLAPLVLTAHGSYDGETFRGAVDLHLPVPFTRPPQSLLEVEGHITDKVFYEDYKLLVESRESVLSQLKQSNLRRLVSLVEGSRELVVDLSGIAKSSGVDRFSVEEVASATGLVQTSVGYATIKSAFAKIREHRRILEREKDLILKYLESKCRSLYVAYLVVDALSKRGSIKGLI